VLCQRPYGRRRPYAVAGEPLVVCDQCWRLAGGAAAVQQRLAAGAGTPALALEPAAASLLEHGQAVDELHPVDRILVDSGVRWAVLRQVVPAARVDLALTVAARTAPEQSKRADSPEGWLGAVEDRIRATSGTEFRYRCKQRRYWYIARVFAQVANRTGRPLSWISQEEIAAAVGCSTKTVQRCEQWLQAEGLLWEVVPGCRLPMCAVPEGETAAERAERAQRLAAAVAAEEASRARALVELELQRLREQGQAAPAGDGGRGPVAAASGAGDVDQADEERPLVNVVPVYELRVPWGPEEHAAAAAAVARLSAGERVALEHRDQLVHWRNAGLYGEVGAIAHDGRLVRLPAGEAFEAVTCGNAVGLLRMDENVYPPQVGSLDQLKSSAERDVDKGRAARGSLPEEPAGFLPSGCAVEGLTGGSEGSRRSGRPSRAVRTAEWLLRSRLDPRLCDGVSVRYLAAQIRGSHLLDRHGWTEEDLADLLHGAPEHTHLPYEVRDARAWIRARFLRAQPLLPPRKLRFVQGVERDSRFFRERRSAAGGELRREEIRQRRAAIDACDLCDELGWQHVPAGVPTARCTHERETGGW
jgi:hypothetical protein